MSENNMEDFDQALTELQRSTVLGTLETLIKSITDNGGECITVEQLREIYDSTEKQYEVLN